MIVMFVGEMILPPRLSEILIRGMAQCGKWKNHDRQFLPEGWKNPIGMWERLYASMRARSIAG